MVDIHHLNADSGQINYTHTLKGHTSRQTTGKYNEIGKNSSTKATAPLKACAEFKFIILFGREF